MSSKRANNQVPFMLNAPIRVRKPNRHNRGQSPHSMSRRAIRQEEVKRSRRENAQQAQGESEPYQKDKSSNTQVNRNVSDETKGVPNMDNQHQNKQKKAVCTGDTQSLANVNITVSLFDIVREYPESVKAVVCQIFDYCIKDKNPLLAFFNTLGSAVVGKYLFNTGTEKVEFTIDMSKMKGVNLKSLMSSQQVKYTPAQASARAFMKKWLKPMGIDPKAENVLEIDLDVADKVEKKHENQQ